MEGRREEGIDGEKGARSEREGKWGRERKKKKRAKRGGRKEGRDTEIDTENQMYIHAYIQRESGG